MATSSKSNKGIALTQENRDVMREFRDEWQKVGLATGPADIRAVAGPISRLYERIGRKPPMFWRCKSPFMAQIVMNVLRAKSPRQCFSGIQYGIGERCWENMAFLFDVHSNMDMYGSIIGRGDLSGNAVAMVRRNIFGSIGRSLGGLFYKAAGYGIFGLPPEYMGELGNSISDRLRGSPIGLRDLCSMNVMRNFGLIDSMAISEIGMDLYDRLVPNVLDGVRDGLQKGMETSDRIRFEQNRLFRELLSKTNPISDEYARLGMLNDFYRQSLGVIYGLRSDVSVAHAVVRGPLDSLRKNLENNVWSHGISDGSLQSTYRGRFYAFTPGEDGEIPVLSMLDSTVLNPVLAMVGNSFWELAYRPNILGNCSNEIYNYSPLSSLNAEFLHEIQANLWTNLWANSEYLGDSAMYVSAIDFLLPGELFGFSDKITEALIAASREELSYISTHMWGSLDSYWIAYYLFPHTHVFPIHSDAEMKELNDWAEIAKNAFWWYPFEDICFVCDRPEEYHFDEQFRLHNTSGMSVKFSDGYGLYSIHGVTIPAWVFEQPQLLTVKKIQEEVNVEIRRVMIDKYGQANYLQDAGAILIHSDGFGDLYRCHVAADEPLVMVKVVNSTPEPDGTYKDYFVRVPPNMRTAEQAVAWLGGFEPGKFEYVQET